MPPPGVRLWVEEQGDPAAPPLLLIMGAQASGVGWPAPFVRLLAEHHRVIRYDHRDTGRSTWAYDEQPYPVARLAEDAVTVLDALGVDRAHAVGLSLGGFLAQLLLADHPERLLSATVMGCGALSATPYTREDGTTVPPGDLPGVDPRLAEMWARPVPDGLDLEAELDRRVEHWRVLQGGLLPFDAAFYRALEGAVIEHTGHHRTTTAHARADPAGLDRTAQLARTDVPTPVVSAPAEPVFPPPHPHHLVQVIQGARPVEIPGMGHALPPAVHVPLAEAILEHTGVRAGCRS